MDVNYCNEMVKTVPYGNDGTVFDNGPGDPVRTALVRAHNLAVTHGEPDQIIGIIRDVLAQRVATHADTQLGDVTIPTESSRYLTAEMSEAVFG